MLKVLKDSFKDFKFYEDGHYYTYKDNPVGVSVTRFIAEYENEFNQQEVAEKVSIKQNKPVEQILAEWKYKADFACAKGTTCHEYAQSLWSDEEWRPLLFDNSEEYRKAIAKIMYQANDFCQDYINRLEHLQDELVVGSAEYDIASAIDHLFYNKLTGGLVLVDYKTNSTLKGYNDDINNRKYTKKMKVPLHKIDDDALHHYYIQLSIYKFLIEKYTGLKVDEMFIVYMSENIENYEIIEIPYLKEEVEKILENRRVKNMNSVPILLIGASGSGKSTSLRNFKKEEVAVVNVLGKPLPFKSDINAPKCDDYNVILKSIANTDKKIIVIDDSNYLITNEFMNKSSVKGYDKYNDMANNFWNLINGIKNIEGGKRIYIIMHEDTDENGYVKPKTIGKLLDDKCNIQGLFTICIRSMFENGNYIFRLKTNGQDCVKTPFGMFENDTMENDLKAFDEVVKEYYEIAE
jgi:hypothetical protein